MIPQIILFISWLMTVPACVAYVSYSDISFIAGALVEPLGTAHFVEGSLVLKLDLSCPLYVHDKLTVFSQKVDLISKDINNFMNFSSDKRAKIIPQSISDTAKNTAFLLRRALETPWVESAQGDGRRRRSVSKDDLKFLQETFTVNPSKEIANLTEHMSIFKGPSANLKSLFMKEFIDSQFSEVFVYNKDLRGANPSANGTNSDHSYTHGGRANIYNSELSFYRSVAQYILYLDSEVSSYLSMAYSGDKRPHNNLFLPYKEVEQMDRRATEILKMNSIVPLTRSNFRMFMEQSYLLPSADSHSLVLVFPYVSPPKYQVFKIIPFPTPSTYGSSERVVLNVQKPVVLLSKDLGYFASLSEKQFDHCTKSFKGDLYSCLLVEPLYFTDKRDKSCINQIFNHFSMSRQTACRYHHFNSTDVFFHKIDGRNIFSLPQQTKAFVSCPNARDQIILEPVTSVPVECKLRTEDFSLPNIKKLTLNDLVNDYSSDTPQEFNISFISFPDVPSINIYKTEEIEPGVGRLIYVGYRATFLDVSSTILPFVNFMLLVSLFLLGSYLWYREKVLRMKSTPSPPPSSLDYHHSNPVYECD